jgi:hypothetical protein
MTGTHHHAQLLVDVVSCDLFAPLALNHGPPDFSPHQEARITGVSHWYLAVVFKMKING